MKVLAYTSPHRGHTLPILPILRELRERGHEVTCRTLDEYIPTLGSIGVQAAPLDPAVVQVELNDWRADSLPDAQVSAMETFARRAPLDAADLRAAIRSADPEFVLVDIMSFGALAVAEASGLPWGSWLPFPAWLPGPGIPPYGPGLEPMRGPQGSARDAAVSALIANAGGAVVHAVNVGRAAASLAPLADAADVLLRPPLLLYMTAEPFEYPRASWPDSFRLIGPSVWDPPSDLPGWLADDPRPVVVVSVSTDFQNDAALITTSLEALRDRPELLVVATTGVTDLSGYEPPSNARLERFVPHAQLLPRAQAVICHGGMGITQHALAHGVPVLAVPFGRDQFEVATRLQVCGAGIKLPASELNVTNLGEAFDRTLSRRSGAQQIATAFASAGGSVKAADAVETQIQDQSDH